LWWGSINSEIKRDKSLRKWSNFSTAVTQGATSILIKALEDSKWFVPIERENIGNLLQERNLIRSQDKNIQRC
jgi:curli production assembly/transport component CsgG